MIRSMPASCWLLLLILTLAFGGSAPAPARESDAGPGGVPTPDPQRFESEILAFEAADRDRPPGERGIVFVGSSSIKNWSELGADFPGLPVLNRGFGGSILADVVYYMDRIVIPYRPRLVVLYAGDNDMVAGRTPDQVVRDYRVFAARLRSALPGTRLAYISIKPSPSRRLHLERARETNRRIQAEIARDSLQTYVDVFTHMLDSSGQPRPELFLPDSLHMTRAGYVLWQRLVAPVLQESRSR